ncbi:MAG: DUF4397 domain-containing protein [Terriglobales bacterium]
MSRLLKTLPLTLAIVALSIIAAGCSNQAQIRVFNGIPDASATLDVYVNASKVAPSLQFTYVYPTTTTPVKYVYVPSGSNTVKAYNQGQTTNPLFTTQGLALSASEEYTVVLAGFANQSPQAYVFQDNNTAPNQNTGQNNEEFRVIDASANTPINVGFDVCFYQTGLTPPTTPQISGLQIGQASSYLTLPYVQQGYTMLVMAHSDNDNCQGNPYINWPYAYPSTTNGYITTIVIVDNANNGGQGVSQTPINLIDLD